MPGATEHWPPCGMCGGPLYPAQALADGYHGYEQPPGKSSPVLWIILGVVGSVLLLCLVVGVIAISLSRDQTVAQRADSAPPGTSRAPSLSQRRFTTSRSTTSRSASQQASNPPRSNSVTSKFNRTEPPTMPSATRRGNAGTVRVPDGSVGLGATDHSFTPRTSWQVSVSPVPPIVFEDRRQALQIEFGKRMKSVVFPRRPSQYVAAEDQLAKRITLFDLQTGRQVSQFPGQLNYDRYLSALSADGAHMATYVRDLHDMGIVAANTKDGQAIHTVDTGKDNRVGFLAFAQPHLLVAAMQANTGSRDARVGVWDVTNQSVVVDFVMEKPNAKHSFGSFDLKTSAISHDGRYYACAAGRIVCVFDLDSGQLAGEVDLETPGVYGNVGALSFSPDGETLVAIQGVTIRDANLFVIQTSSGQSAHIKIDPSEFKPGSSSRTENRIQFLPELASFLIDGKYVVEQSTGRVIYQLDVFDGNARPLAGDRLVGVVENKGIAELRLPSEVSQVVAAVQQGGDMLDALWGEASVVALDQARRLTTPSESVAWSMPPSEPLSPTNVKSELALPPLVGPGNKAISSATTKLVFSARGDHLAWLPYNESDHSRLQVVNLKTGRISQVIDMLPNAAALDISPDGSLVAVARSAPADRSRHGIRRLDLFSLPLQKHVLAWEVKAAGTQASTVDTPPHRFFQAYFLQNNVMLTTMGGPSHVLWVLPQLTPRWVLEGDLTLVEISAERKFGLFHSATLRKHVWLEFSTGRWMGEYPTSESPAIAVSPDRTKFAWRPRVYGYSKIMVGDTDASPAQAFQLPNVRGIFGWIDDRYLAVAGAVIDTKQQGVICQANLSATKVTGDGGLWTFNRYGTKYTLKRNGNLRANHAAKFSGLTPKTIKPIVGPGTRIALGSGVPRDAASMRQHEQAFQERGWILDQSASIRINLSSRQLQGRTQTYRSGLGGIVDGPGNSTQTVHVDGGKEVTVTITDGSRVLWDRKTQMGGGSAPYMVILRGNETLQDKVNPGRNGRPNIDFLPDMIFPTDPYKDLPAVSIGDG